MLVRLFNMCGVVMWKMVPGEIFTFNEKRRSWNCLLEKEVTTANLKTINRQLWRTGRQPWVYCYLLPAWPFAQTHWFKVHFRNYNTEETASSWCVLLQDPKVWGIVVETIGRRRSATSAQGSPLPFLLLLIEWHPLPISPLLAASEAS